MDGNGTAEVNKAKELGDKSLEYKDQVTQLFVKLYQTALDCGQLAISTDSQWVIFRKKILDAGNEAQRSLNAIFQNTLIAEVTPVRVTEVIDFRNGKVASNKGKE